MDFQITSNMLKTRINATAAFGLQTEWITGRDEGTPREIFEGTVFPLRDSLPAGLHIPFDEFQNHRMSANAPFMFTYNYSYRSLEA